MTTYHPPTAARFVFKCFYKTNNEQHAEINNITFCQLPLPRSLQIRQENTDKTIREISYKTTKSVLTLAQDYESVIPLEKLNEEIAFQGLYWTGWTGEMRTFYPAFGTLQQTLTPAFRIYSNICRSHSICDKQISAYNIC